jgi:hypothetical protein
MANESKELAEKNQVQKAETEKEYTGFEVIGERGEFGYLGLMWHHNNLELETAIRLVKAGYSGIKLV